MTYRAVLFDLDGTLLDTYEDIADSLNVALAAVGRPALSTATIRGYIGDGVETLIARALADATERPEQRALCEARFRKEYSEHWARKTRPFDGVLELLDRLSQHGIPSAVLSNKPDPLTQLCVERFLSAARFRVVLGTRADVPRKPNPAGALRIAAEMQIAPAEIIYLGDTATDMQTAVAAGMAPVGATWGYRSAEELTAAGAASLIASPLELMHRFNA